MNVDNGKISTLEEFEKRYGKEHGLSIVPIPEKAIGPMSSWGKKKRERYAELLKLGLSKDESFNCVENNKGRIETKNEQL
jgi:hypothetical protein